jgi:hypothetical protein
VNLRRGNVYATNAAIVRGPFNERIDFSVIQLNHYKCKTLPEFRYIRARQRADIQCDIHENVDESFRAYDINEVEDTAARDFYRKLLLETNIKKNDIESK